ncbi:TPA: host cell division inhibitor Icd-like protein [Klebsiella oxytoca]|uniref:Host cell division inhibitor Icd-like protein n=1 Tax=Klebsiella oxytoca TaxID=571 RepID=A0AAN5LEG5_KLEOX|nr:host cell division inhibitor Icd-like protein [Klebsiella oxytoca]
MTLAWRGSISAPKSAASPPPLTTWRVTTMCTNRPCFVWRFVSGQNATYTTTAASEREARSRLPAGHLVFVARIRVQEETSRV